MTDNEQITACAVVFDCFSDLRLCAKNIGIRHEKGKCLCRHKVASVTLYSVITCLGFTKANDDGLVSQ